MKPDKLVACAMHVLDAVAARLDMPGRVYLNPGGMVAWDHGVCDQLAVRVITIVPRIPEVRPRTGPDPMATVPAWVVKLGVQVTQCVPVVDDLGRAPSADQLNAAAVEILRIANKVRISLLCDIDREYRCRPLRWTSLGPEGGMAGGEWEADLEIQS